MLHGTYRDEVHDWHNHLLFDSGWSANTIVETAWPLIAGLLKNDANLAGILFWAVGAGDPAWDGARVAANPATRQLHDEVQRLPLPPENIAYLDLNDATVDTPTHRLEISASFSWPNQAQTLREFGLFGGDATATKDSGYLFNYVIQPRIELPAGATLTRRLRLRLHPTVGPQRLGVPRHWLEERPVTVMNGIGEAYARILADSGIETVRDLANVEPAMANFDIPRMKLVELRAKARLALQTAVALAPVPGLLNQSAWDVIMAPTATLAADAGAPVPAVASLREQINALQLTLSHHFLQEVTIAELLQST